MFSMTTSILDLALNFLAMAVLVFGLYAPRHGRRDLVAAFLGVNVGVLAVCSVLSSTAVGMGVGLGLFGVLSIIRLRSDELAQHEIAYYFSALALGLIGGLSVASPMVTAGLMAMILLLVLIGDHPRLLRRHRRQVMVLDRAHLDEVALRRDLEHRLGATVTGVTVVRTDLVDDTTTVDVRYRLLGTPAATTTAATAPAMGVRA